MPFANRVIVLLNVFNNAEADIFYETVNDFMQLRFWNVAIALDCVFFLCVERKGWNLICIKHILEDSLW